MPIRRALLAALSLALAAPAGADEAGWAALARPGAVGLMRHALAPGMGDPPGFTLGDCATQRNLDARGRAQAEAIGRAVRERGLEVDRVLTSRWCRSRETAERLGLGEPEPFPPLDSFFADRSTAEAQTEAVRAWLAGLPEGERALLVTHQVNISALTGRFARSGEIVVIEVGPEGEVEVVGDVLIAP